MLECRGVPIAVSLTLAVPDDIAQAAQHIAAATGTSPEALLLAALKAHFPPVTPELQEEFDAWERASDEDTDQLDAQLEAPEGPSSA